MMGTRSNLSLTGRDVPEFRFSKQGRFDAYHLPEQPIVSVSINNANFIRRKRRKKEGRKSGGGKKDVASPPCTLWTAILLIT